MRWSIGAFNWNDTSNKRELRAAKNRKITLRLKEPSSLEFSVPGDHPDALLIKELITDAVVNLDGVDLARFRCGPSMDSLAESGYGLSFSFGDYRQVLRRRRLNPTDTLFYPATSDEADIVWGLISNVQSRTNGNYGISKGIGFPTGDRRQATFTAGQWIGEQIDQLGNLDNGFDWDIRPNMKLDIYNQRRGGNNNVFLDYGKSVSAMTRNRTASDFANDLMVTGDSNTSPVIAIDATATTSLTGRWDGVESFPSVSDPTTIVDRAPYSVAKRAQLTATYSLKLAPGFWRGPAHIGLGDTVRYRVKRGRLDDNLFLRVMVITIALSDDGGEDVQLSMGTDL